MEKSSVIQHRMILGTGPSRNRPGGGVNGESLNDELIKRLAVSKPRLLVRMEWCEKPDELWRPSDRCERDRSVSG